LPTLRTMRRDPNDGLHEYQTVIEKQVKPRPVQQVYGDGRNANHSIIGRGL
jgi:hypothetical protein